MSVVAIATLIEGHRFCAGISHTFAAELAAMSFERMMAMDEMLFRQGEPADHVFLIVSGMVSVELYAPGRDPIVVDQLGTGEVVGWSWLCPPYRWSFDGRAVQPSTLIDIDAKALRARFEVDPLLGYEILNRFIPVMARRLSSSRERMVESLIDRD